MTKFLCLHITFPLSHNFLATDLMHKNCNEQLLPVIILEEHFLFLRVVFFVFFFNPNILCSQGKCPEHKYLTEHNQIQKCAIKLFCLWWWTKRILLPEDPFCDNPLTKNTCPPSNSDPGIVHDTLWISAALSSLSGRIFLLLFSQSEFVQDENGEGKGKNTLKAAHQKHQSPHQKPQFKQSWRHYEVLLLDTAQKVLKQSDKTCHCLPNYPFLAFLLKPCILSTKKPSLTWVQRETSSFIYLAFVFFNFSSIFKYLLS